MRLWLIQCRERLQLWLTLCALRAYARRLWVRHWWPGPDEAEPAATFPYQPVHPARYVALLTQAELGELPHYDHWRFRNRRLDRWLLTVALIRASDDLLTAARLAYLTPTEEAAAHADDHDYAWRQGIYRAEWEVA